MTNPETSKKLEPCPLTQPPHYCSFCGKNEADDEVRVVLGPAVFMIEVDERLTTQVCSECGSLPPSRPRGIADLGIREWACSDCGAVHDRDVNAARNILRLGLETLAEGAAR